MKALLLFIASPETFGTLVEKRAKNTKLFHRQATTKRNIVQSIETAGTVHDGERRLKGPLWASTLKCTKNKGSEANTRRDRI